MVLDRWMRFGSWLEISSGATQPASHRFLEVLSDDVKPLLVLGDSAACRRNFGGKPQNLRERGAASHHPKALQGSD